MSGLDVTGEPILELCGVTAAYGGIEALKGVDLEVPQGGVFAVLGPNGAGRTTMLSVAAGLHPATSGRVRFAGDDVTGRRADDLARRGLCLVPEGRGVFPSLSVRENLRMATHSGTDMATVEQRVYAAFPRLADRRNQVAGTMSGGEQQMLALARAVGTNPQLLLVDELSMGLAPMIVRQLYELVGQLAADGLTVVVVEQFARTVLGVAERGALVVGGRVVRAGTTAELEEVLASAYFGA